MADEITLDDYLLTHAKEAYERQLQRVEKLEGRFGSVTTQLSIVGGGLIWMANEFAWGAASERSRVAFLVCFIGAMALFLGGSSLLIWANGGFREHDYDLEPELNDLHREAYKIKTAKNNDDKAALAVVKLGMLNNYSLCAQENQKINDRRGMAVLRGQQCACIAFVFLVVALWPFYTARHDAPAKIHEVKIVNGKPAQP